MLTWLQENLGTILITLGLIAAAILAVYARIRDRKNGKGGCGCGCAHCAMHEMCHNNNDHT